MPERELDQLFDELETLEATVDEDARERVAAVIDAAEDVEDEVAYLEDRGAFGNVIRGYDRADITETFLGSLLFGVPMAVEGGTTEVGAFFAARPWFLAGTVAATVALVYGVLYVADIQDVRVKDPLLGVLPRRFVGVISISLGTAVVLLTGWGRIDWTAPAVALGACVAAFFPMAIGAALGDILPGS
ncbi:DUF2391 family protein [Salarchaeum sp. JOR-1]|uniref:DUF2391 family protein n=1 Tax=Salarchaeum sp. JOR-1 TaxID=2599399 RepID=UPI00119893D2|nr:DUF2391 family protein [Salarchaeum sp. JOR-1]QDX40879.1 DUF2391 family protein [Salarchaeum sp. JOR-1]